MALAGIWLGLQLRDGAGEPPAALPEADVQVATAAAEPAAQVPQIDSDGLLKLATVLSADDMQGRMVGTPGNAKARELIEANFKALGLKTFGDSYAQRFPVLPDAYRGRPEAVEGVNLVGWLPGRTPGEGPVMVVSAHYDHLGVIDGEIYNGADDNASGVAAMIAVMRHFHKEPPEHDIVFAALDAEEADLIGARQFVLKPGFDRARIALNLNFDMVGRSATGELHVAGTHHTPALKPMVEGLIADAPVTLKMGHDTPELGGNDWTLQSDHGAFYEAGIPFLYFGVEDHPGYHQPTDDYAALTHDFFIRSAQTLVMAAERADAGLAPRAPN